MFVESFAPGFVLFLLFVRLPVYQVSRLRHSYACVSALSPSLRSSSCLSASVICVIHLFVRLPVYQRLSRTI